MSLRAVLVLLLVCKILLSCQVKPTQVGTTLPLMQEGPFVDENIKLEELLKEDPLIIDTRSPFEFNLSHVPSAINLQWEHFTKIRKDGSRIIDSDTMSMARRLSLYGVTKERPVIVLGKGQMGQGEEGFVAWLLSYLGVQKVYSLHYQQMRNVFPKGSLPPKNAVFWNPQIETQMLIDQNELLANLKQNTKDVIIINISENAAFESDIHSVKQVRISWKRILNEKLQLNKDVFKKIKEPLYSHKVYIVSDQLTTSAAVARAFRMHNLFASVLF